MQVPRIERARGRTGKARQDVEPRRNRPGLGGSARTPYRLTTPMATKTKRTRSEIRVRIPQTNATLLLRTVLSFRPTATSHALLLEHPCQREGPDHLEG